VVPLVIVVPYVQGWNSEFEGEVVCARISRAKAVCKFQQGTANNQMQKTGAWDASNIVIPARF